MPARTQPKQRVKELATDAQRKQIFRGYLAFDYDGIGQEIHVNLSKNPFSGVYKAKVSAQASGSGTPFETGTPVVLFSNHGRLEAMGLGFGLGEDVVGDDNIIEIDADKIKPGSIEDFTPFASKIKPPIVVDELPSLPDDAWEEGSQVFLTTDGKLYRNKNGAWTAEVASIDMTGTLTKEQIEALELNASDFAAGFGPVIVVSSLPSLPDPAYPANSLIVLSTTGKVYRNFGGSWVNNVDGADIISGTIVASDKLVSNSIVTGLIQAGAIVTSHISAGSLAADRLVANSITAGQIAVAAIGADQIAANAITASKLASDFILAHEVWLGGTNDTPLKVFSNDGFNTLLGSWRAAALTVASGRFILEGMPLDSPQSNGVQFWDFTNRVVRADGIVTAYSTSTFSDTNFHGTTLNGALGVSSTGGGRIYARVGGSWKWVAVAAGFTIPKYEGLCPACGDLLRMGEKVIGQLNTIREDGAIHGYYRHLDCGVDDLNAGIVLLYELVNAPEWNFDNDDPSVSDQTGVSKATKLGLEQAVQLLRNGFGEGVAHSYDSNPGSAAVALEEAVAAQEAAGKLAWAYRAYPNIYFMPNSIDSAEEFGEPTKLP